MSTVIRGVGRMFGSFGRAVRWSLASVDDAPKSYQVPLAGADHGPIPSVRLRLDTDARRPRR